MPHADSSLVPESIKTKVEFWDHVHQQLSLLLDGQRNWVTNLANTSSLIFNALLAFPEYFGSDDTKSVNWCGFYLEPHLFPFPRGSTAPVLESSKLFLGPFCGKPACQYINVTSLGRGVCADAYLRKKTILVEEVESYPGHIACDGDTKSEIVCPLIRDDGSGDVVGVLDLDCLAIGGFDTDDQVGLEKICKLVINACDW